jgi:FG-GAP repeat
MIHNSRITRLTLVLCLLTALCPSIFGTADDRFSTQTKLVDPNPNEVGSYGLAIDVDGDTAVVTRLANFFTGVPGTAFIYVRQGSNWTLQQTFSEQDNEPNVEDGYGFSVALKGDTLVVGAIGDSTAAFNAGAAYVYVREGTTWTFQQKLTAAQPVSNSAFGVSVDVLEDTVVVGAHLADSAYVFHRDAGVWSQQQQLLPNDGPDQAFGSSVSISGQTIAVGAPTFSAPDAEFSGAVYVFVNDGSGWIQQERFTAHDVAADQNLGYTVGISGDTIVASAPGESVGAHSTGAVYIFERNGVSWDEKKRLVERSGGKLDSYGVRVAIDGDTIVIGNGNDSTVAQFAGAGEVYVRNGNAGWSLKYVLTANDGGFLDGLGRTVAISGNTIMLGAPGQNNMNGAAYIYQ